MHFRNEPNVHKAEELANPKGWHGSELSVTILGNWQYYRAKIHKYVPMVKALMVAGWVLLKDLSSSR